MESEPICRLFVTVRFGSDLIDKKTSNKPKYHPNVNDGCIIVQVYSQTHIPYLASQPFLTVLIGTGKKLTDTIPGLSAVSNYSYRYR
ncbi:hypothetical protein L484_008324 [Morus notabilis]|uniref:Uncharacterized protein n=1 Tax=Morus notabilis TaxID=981085 RepID=W9RZZ2_9ROSA|nr:hypothetical protein L484_008324 [Morus notabilis]